MGCCYQPHQEGVRQGTHHRLKACMAFSPPTVGPTNMAGWQCSPHATSNSALEVPEGPDNPPASPMEVMSALGVGRGGGRRLSWGRRFLMAAVGARGRGEGKWRGGWGQRRGEGGGQSRSSGRERMHRGADRHVGVHHPLHTRTRVNVPPTAAMPATVGRGGSKEFRTHSSYLWQ
jgi:hypothetical protein